MTLAYLSWFSRKLESTTTRPLDVNLSFLYTQQNRVHSDIAPKLQIVSRREKVLFSTVGKVTFVYMAIAKEQLHDQTNIMLQTS